MQVIGKYLELHYTASPETDEPLPAGQGAMDTDFWNSAFVVWELDFPHFTAVFGQFSLTMSVEESVYHKIFPQLITGERSGAEYGLVCFSTSHDKYLDG